MSVEYSCHSPSPKRVPSLDSQTERSRPESPCAWHNPPGRPSATVYNSFDTGGSWTWRDRFSSGSGCQGLID